MAVSLSSDTAPDFPCTPCSDEGTSIEAVVFCVNCSDYFCRTCYRRHNRLAEAQGHHIRGREEFRDITPPQPISANPDQSPDQSTERCARHHGTIVNMFCEDDNVVCCSICISLEHRTCETILYIPDIARARQTDRAIDDITTKMSNEIVEVNNLIQDRQAQQARITREKDKSLDDVRDRRNAIDRYMDTIQDGMVNEIVETYTDFNEKIKSVVKSCGESADGLGSLLNKIRNSSQTDRASEVFIYMNQAEALLNETKQKREEYQRGGTDLLTIEFESSGSAAEMFSTTTNFGFLKAGQKVPAMLVNDSITHIDIRCDSDSSPCDCVDLCQLADSTLIITDFNNKTIKSLKFNNEYSVCDALAMCGSPWGVCPIGDNEVAVTIPRERKVSLISVGRGMTLMDSFSVDSECNGIACVDSCLFIGHGLASKVSVYDQQGNCLQTISTDQTGSDLFGSPNHLCVLSEKKHIIVTDSLKGIVVIDSSGNEVSQNPCRGMEVSGVCIDTSVNIFVTDSASRAIWTVGLDNHTDSTHSLTSLSWDFFGIPQAVFFDRLTERLLVCDFNSGLIRKFIVSYQYIRP